MSAAPTTSDCTNDAHRGSHSQHPLVRCAFCGYQFDEGCGYYGCPNCHGEGLDYPSPKLLDVFCGVGGWSKEFMERGWYCVGVDLEDFSGKYPGDFLQNDALNLDGEWIDQFDAVLMSPPCEEYARAWLPWLRGDKKPEQWAIDLLEWSVALCDRPGRMVECSNFAARHVKGSTRVGSYSLWGDVPLLMRQVPRGKMAKSGLRPDLRAEIPAELARSVAEWFEAGLGISSANAQGQGRLPEAPPRNTEKGTGYDNQK